MDEWFQTCSFNYVEVMGTNGGRAEIIQRLFRSKSLLETFYDDPKVFRSNMCTLQLQTSTISLLRIFCSEHVSKNDFQWQSGNVILA